MKQEVQTFALSVEDSDADFFLLNKYVSKHFPEIKLDRVNIVEDMNILLESNEYNIIFLDLLVQGKSLYPLISSLKLIYPNTEIIVVSGQNDISVAINCVRLGTTYVSKGEMLENDLILALASTKKLINKQKDVDLLKSIVFEDHELPVLILDPNSQKIIFRDFDSLPLGKSIELEDSNLEFTNQIFQFLNDNLKINQHSKQNLFYGSPKFLSHYAFYIYKLGGDKAVKHQNEANKVNLLFMLCFSKNLVSYFPSVRELEKDLSLYFTQMNQLEKINPRLIKSSKIHFINLLSKGFRVSRV